MCSVCSLTVRERERESADSCCVVLIFAVTVIELSDPSIS